MVALPIMIIFLNSHLLNSELESKEALVCRLEIYLPATKEI